MYYNVLFAFFTFSRNVFIVGLVYKYIYIYIYVFIYIPRLLRIDTL